MNFPTIITADDYREFQLGKNSPINDDDILSAINVTFIQLDGICNNQITIRWNLEEGTEESFNEVQKDLIKRAFLLQTKYNLDYDNDTSEGTTQSTFGSNNFSSTRPKRDKITQDVLNLLNKAGVYNQFVASNINNSVLNQPKSNNFYAPLDNYVTYEVGDARYVQKFFGQEFSGKILVVDDNGYVRAKSISELINKE